MRRCRNGETEKRTIVLSNPSFSRAPSSCLIACSHSGNSLNRCCSTKACSVRIALERSSYLGEKGSLESQKLMRTDGWRCGTEESRRRRLR